jgi:dsDNA-binding SOS-regulon protein
MKNLKLITPIDSFTKRIENILFKNEIELDKSIKSDEDLTLFKKRVKSWQNEILNELECSFTNHETYFRDRLMPIDDSLPSRYEIQNKRTNGEKKDVIMKKLNQQKDFVFDFKNVLPILDKVNNKKDIIRIEFNKPTEIIYLILSKLKILKDGNYFRIDLILAGNGIDLKNGVQEYFEYVDELKKNKWVDFEGNYLGKITLKGEIYLEKQKKFFTKKESDLISKKIDLIILRLEKLGYGQEILFEELEELKDLYTKLNKKNWSQILKGKLLDMVGKKIIDMTVVQLVSDDFLEKDFTKLLNQ